MSERQVASRNRNRRRANKKNDRSRPVRTVVLLVVFVALLFAGFFGVQSVLDRIGPADDYSGDGNGAVTVTIDEGATGAAIAQTLAENDVVASSQAMYQLLLNDPRADMVQPGTYELRQQMSAEAALSMLTDGSARVVNRITIPEGRRLDSIVQTIVDNTDISESDIEAALDNPDSIGLPAEANGNAEGYLFPATYEVGPDMTAEQLLGEMISTGLRVQDRLNLSERSAAMGLTTGEVLTLASIVEHEAFLDEDFARVARVFLNRVEINMALQSDATVNYAVDKEGDVWTTPEERNTDSPYNTYRYPGIPPGPIGAPGERAIQAILEPADGTWLYFLTVDLDTGETAYSDTYAEHQQKCFAAYGADTQC